MLQGMLRGMLHGAVEMMMRTDMYINKCSIDRLIDKRLVDRRIERCMDRRIYV